MSQLDVQNMMEAFKNFVSSRIANQNLGIEQQRATTEAKQQQAEQEYQQGQLENQRKQLENLHEYQNKTLEAASFINKLAQYHDILGLTQAAEGGIHIPGETSQQITEPGPSTVMQAVAPIVARSNISPTLGGSTTPPADMGAGGNRPFTVGGQPTQVTQRILHLPLDNSTVDIPLRTPGEKIQQAKDTATETAITQEPAWTQALRAEYMKQAAQLEQEMYKQGEENKRNTEKVQGAITEANTRAAATKYAANISGGIMPGETPAMAEDRITKIINGVRNGNLDAETLKGLFRNSKQFTPVANALVMANVKPLEKEDSAFVKHSTGSLALIPLMQEYNDVFDNSNAAEREAPGTQAHVTLDRLQNQIKDLLLSGAGQLRTAGRLSKYTMDAIDKAYAPSGGIFGNLNAFGQSAMKNHQALNAWEDIMGRAVNDQLANYPEEQRQAILRNFGGTVKVMIPATKKVIDVPVNELKEALRPPYNGQVVTGGNK